MSAHQLSELLDEYLAAGNRTYSPRTKHAYRHALATFTRETDIATLEQLTASDAWGLTTKLRDVKLKPATVQLSLTVVKRLVKHARLRKLTKWRDIEDVEGPRIGNNVPVHNVLKVGELEKVLAVLEKEKDWLGVAVFLMLERHGLRASELVGLTWANVEGDDTLAFIGKGGKPARLHWKEDARAAVLRLKGKQKPSEPLVPTTYLDMHRLVTKTTKRVLKRRVTPHGLRATFISRVIAKRGIEDARKLARQASIITTQRYSRWEVLDDAD